MTEYDGVKLARIQDVILTAGEAGLDDSWVQHEVADLVETYGGHDDDIVYMLGQLAYLSGCEYNISDETADEFAEELRDAKKKDSAQKQKMQFIEAVEETAMMESP